MIRLLVRSTFIVVIAMFAVVVVARFFFAPVSGPSCAMHYDQAQMIVSPTSDMGASLGSVFSRQWQSGAWYDQRTEETNPTTGYIFAGPFASRADAQKWSAANTFSKDGATVCTGRYSG